MKNKRILSFKYALEGLFFTLKTQPNMRIHTLLSGLILCISWYLKINKTEWLWIILSIFFVMVTETVNTAIEQTVNLVTTETTPLAKHAKDCAAAAVLLASLFTLSVAGIILLPKLI